MAAQADPRKTEDRIFRLWGLKHAGADPKDIEAAVADLIRSQRRMAAGANSMDRARTDRPEHRKTSPTTRPKPIPVTLTRPGRHWSHSTWPAESPPISRPTGAGLPSSSNRKGTTARGSSSREASRFSPISRADFLTGPTSSSQRRPPVGPWRRWPWLVRRREAARRSTGRAGPFASCCPTV